MKQLFKLVGLACTISPAMPATASPPTFAPAVIEYSVTADCPGRRATLTYSLILRETDKAALALTSLSVSRAGNSGTAEPDLGELPQDVRAIERPFVERAIPMCSDKDKFLFVLYIAADEDVMLPTYINHGRVTQLYVSVAANNEVSVFTAEPSWSKLRAKRKE